MTRGRGARVATGLGSRPSRYLIDWKARWSLLKVRFSRRWTRSSPGWLRTCISAGTFLIFTKRSKRCSAAKLICSRDARWNRTKIPFAAGPSWNRPVTSLPPRQLACLVDIFNSVRAIQSYVAGQTHEQFMKDSKDAGCGFAPFPGRRDRRAGPQDRHCVRIESRDMPGAHHSSVDGSRVSLRLDSRFNSCSMPIA